MTTEKHTVLVLNPGHFHAALTLRRSHPRLSDDVYVYAEDGADVDTFLRMVESFNRRAQAPTHWNLHVYRGADFIDRLRAERRGDVVIMAGKNQDRMVTIHLLHGDGFLVLGDKPWLIVPDQLGSLRKVMAGAPLAMDIMTERYEIANRVQQALAARPEIFGRFRVEGSEVAIDIQSVHHLYKVVNQRPLVRPPWYFDVAVQGEGITDVTTHLVDLTQWMVGEGRPFAYEQDVQLLSARQWPTAVPRETFEHITGLDDFPPELRPTVHNDVLSYLCNAELSYRMRGVPVRLETLWHLAIPEGGGDTHHAVMRGTEADLIVEQGPDTASRTELTVHPVNAGLDYARALQNAIASLHSVFPGLGLEASGSVFRVTIPAALRTTHEEHFAAVLEQFIAYADRGESPDNLGPDLVTKYTLLAQARELSHRTS